MKASTFLPNAILSNSITSLIVYSKCAWLSFCWLFAMLFNFLFLLIAFYKVFALFSSVIFFISAYSIRFRFTFMNAIIIMNLSSFHNGGKRYGSKNIVLRVAACCASCGFCLHHNPCNNRNAIPDHLCGAHFSTRRDSRGKPYAVSQSTQVS